MNKYPWHSSYPEGVKHEINPDSFPNITKMVDEQIVKYGDKIAFENMGKGISFTELGEKIDAFASYIQNHTNLKRVIG